MVAIAILVSRQPAPGKLKKLPSTDCAYKEMSRNPGGCAPREGGCSTRCLPCVEIIVRIGCATAPLSMPPGYFSSALIELMARIARKSKSPVSLGFVQPIVSTRIFARDRDVPSHEAVIPSRVSACGNGQRKMQCSR